MADQNQCISIVNARVTVQPLSDQKAIDLGGPGDDLWKLVDRIANLGVKIFIVAACGYLVWEIGNAFASGAIQSVVK
jgi:biotin operon repressor